MIANPVAYQKAMLAEQAKANAQGATPNLAAIAGEYAAARGKSEADTMKFQSDVKFNEAKLKEADREFQAKLALDREMLDTFKKNNEWATGLAVLNLGVKGLQIPANAQTLAKQDKFQTDQQANWEKGYQLQVDANALQAVKDAAQKAAMLQQTTQFNSALQAAAAARLPAAVIPAQKVTDPRMVDLMP